MANRERGEVDLTVGGKTYTLRLTVNGICELEARTKSTLGQVFVALRMVDVSKTRELLYQALQPYHAKEFKDIKTVGLLMQEGGGVLDEDAPIVVALGELFDLMNPAKSENGSDPLVAQAGNGARSIATPDELA